MNCLFAAAQTKFSRPTGRRVVGHRHEGHGHASRRIAIRACRIFRPRSGFITRIRKASCSPPRSRISTRPKNRATIRPIPAPLFGFQEAAALWDGNAKARAGVSTAKLAYAQTRRKRKISIWPRRWSIRPTCRTSTCIARSSAAQRERDTRQQRLRNVRRIALGLGVCIVIGASGAARWSTREENRAVNAEVEAKGDRDKALKAEGVAKNEKVKADKSAAEGAAIGDRR